eukprot:CAMPEP_0202974678 /NCGR_PEP_ID=MMETSP1396-20130829/62715_1 /ASSEMBLY_ACC=CAM_ASM_000872 /TAXON_ID= /ORGANISM="Pseudokeronopsis sp., Strain Brazil" /LENGTH=57 /DNA_ID=CAMNT_0049708945 /DNA_START=1 /DNA_END=174 /DNA_ORIENTATION=-
MKAYVQNQKLGGLGANIGGPDWEKAVKKNQVIIEYDMKRKGKPGLSLQSLYSDHSNS